MKIRVGFTGTQFGMVLAQHESLWRVMRELATPFEFHHGDCIGADAQAHDMAKDLECEIHVHPPIKVGKRAFCPGVMHPARGYMERNQDIVDSCDVLIATPRLSEKDPASKRSGTWATVRRARKAGKWIVIVRPNGNVERSWI